MSQQRLANALYGQSAVANIHSLNEVYDICQSSASFYSALATEVKDHNLRALSFDLGKTTGLAKTLFWSSSARSAIPLKMSSSHALAKKYRPLLELVDEQDNQQLLHQLLAHERVILRSLMNFLEKLRGHELSKFIADIAVHVQTRTEILWATYQTRYLR
jgi:hypothetical protein